MFSIRKLNEKAKHYDNYGSTFLDMPYVSFSVLHLTIFLSLTLFGKRK